MRRLRRMAALACAVLGTTVVGCGRAEVREEVTVTMRKGDTVPTVTRTETVVWDDKNVKKKTEQINPDGSTTPVPAASSK